MRWLERYRKLFKEIPADDEIDIEQALKRLRCVTCGGPLTAELRSAGPNQDVWEFRCVDAECESNRNH